MAERAGAGSGARRAAGRALGGPALSVVERRRLGRAVSRAEDVTGLELCVYLGPGVGDAHADAEQAFVGAGLEERPAVLVLVAPDRRRVDVVTAPQVRERVGDEACARAIEAMTPHLAKGKWVDGIARGLDVLVEAAGPGKPPPGAGELPDVLGGE